jgi:hypothetical protein
MRPWFIAIPPGYLTADAAISQRRSARRFTLESARLRVATNGDPGTSKRITFAFRGMHARPAALAAFTQSLDKYFYFGARASDSRNFRPRQKPVICHL